MSVKDLWVATPSNAEDVVTLANWAYKSRYTLRASGFMHNWSPLTVTKANTRIKNVILVDTTKRLVEMKITSSPNSQVKAVQVQTGTSMNDLLTFLEKNEMGMYAVPAAGDVSVGGVLAIGGHGSGFPAINEKIPAGFSYGTLSNLIISLTAVVWDSALETYVLKTFLRSDADCKAFLIHLGRAFITEVTLLVGPNYNLRCLSRTDITGTELFSDPAAAKPNSQTFASLLKQSGRVETIMWPFTNNPWVKIWSIEPKKPSASRKVSEPFNYPFSNFLEARASKLIGNLTNDASVITPAMLVLASKSVSVGLKLFDSSDIWGPSKNLLLYIKPNTLRLTANGYSILTNSKNVQSVVSTITEYVKNLVDDYASERIYPFNGPVEIRATSLDQPGILPFTAEPPTLSAVRPVENHPEFDVAIWFDVLSLPGALHLFEAMAKVESFLFSKYNGTDAIVRVEWSKGWAYTENSAWSNENVLRKIIPSSFPKTQNDGFNWAVSTFDKYDPHRIFSNEFLDIFFVKS